jgi:hypothetical protein
VKSRYSFVRLGISLSARRTASFDIPHDSRLLTTARMGDEGKAVAVDPLGGFAVCGPTDEGNGKRRLLTWLGTPVKAICSLSCAVLALMLALLPGYAQLAQPSEAPPSVEPPYVSLTSKYLASVMKDPTTYYEDFEISEVRWVHSFKGWSWLACVHFTDHGHLRTYVIFIQNDAVVDGRYAVLADACGSQTYTPFDLTTGKVGRPTRVQLPPIY